MSKTIYDEALEIIDKNTFELGKGLDVLKPTYRDTVVKALEQAQKQEKLLELYKELSLLERKRATTLKTKNTLKYNHYNKIIDFLNRQIKELENETISN